jgi:hypothetical protein
MLREMQVIRSIYKLESHKYPLCEISNPFSVLKCFPCFKLSSNSVVESVYNETDLFYRTYGSHSGDYEEF